MDLMNNLNSGIPDLCTGLILASRTFATKLTFYPQQVIKGQPVTLTCEAEPLPNDVTYIWLKNGNKVENLASSKWTIVQASIDTRANFTCIVESKNGTISQADVFINVIAPPAFILRLNPYHGVLDTTTDIFLTCIIECYPLCTIAWYKDDKRIDADDPLYYIRNVTVTADERRNDFESAASTLAWNFTNWPNQRLNKKDSPSQYSCQSNSVLQDVKSTTYLAMEYPPENITLSTKAIINVTEDETPVRVTCTAKGNPGVIYVWKHTPTGAVVGRDKTLNLGKLSRSEEHNYTCEVFNKHGTLKREVHYNVLYKPSCSIELSEIDKQESLICKASGNPQEFTFKWTLTSEEEVRDNIIDKNNQSYLILNSTQRNLRTYECHVNNSVGTGNSCTKTVSGRPFEIELSGVAGNITEGMFILFNCNVKATFTVEITWYNNSSPIESTAIVSTFRNDTGVITSSSKFRFTAHRWDDHTSLKCSASNEFLEKHSIPPLEKTLLLEVLYPPAVTVSSIETTFVESENRTAVLFCNYDANPLKPVTVVWHKNGEVLRRTEGKHTFVTLNNLSLIIASVAREDIGEYSCVLSNEVGESTSQNLSIDVLYVPTVEVTMTSSLPSKTSFKAGNVTLTCKICSGNPSTLSEVYWLVDDVFLKEYIANEIYHPQVGKIILSKDSHVVSLREVDENYLKSFKCQGVNKAGIGPESKPVEVKITYTSFSTTLIQEPETVFKGESVTLKCSVKGDSVNNLTYVWFKNGYRLHDVHSSKWTIKKTSLELRRNISCYGTNGKRRSIRTNISVKMAARPSFLSRPNPYLGVLKSSNSVSLTCKVECYPICSILWTTKGKVITTDSLYNISKKVHPADFLRNDFETVESTLTFSRNHIQDDGLYLYSCASVSTTSDGPEVNASMLLSLEYPPEDLTLSETFVDVKENHVPKTVKCEGTGKPALDFVWKKSSTNVVIASGDTLALGKLSKPDEGNYTCEGYNKHGNQSAMVYFHVTHYKPICSIKFGTLGTQHALICSAHADTPEVAFTWKANSSDGTEKTLNSVTMNSHSFFIFNETADFTQKYICLVENSIGQGIPCETFLPRPPTPATIKYLPLKVLKKSNVTLECSVDDPGFPKNLTYVWLRNKNNVHNSSVSTWNISSVSLHDRNATFTCLVKNDAGFSTQSEEISLNIIAPPRFIQTPNRSLSIYYDSKNLSLTCGIECYPACSVIWLKNGQLLDFEKTKLYYVENNTSEASYEEGLFESVRSTLVWNMTSWPGNILGKIEPVSKYTCFSSDSANLKSRITFSSTVIIEFAPENVTVSQNIVYVPVDEIPSVVNCSAKGHPLNYVWIKNSTGEAVAKTGILQFGNISKSDGGYYTCLVYNKYGGSSAGIYFNVLFKPKCKVSFDSSTNSLTCSAEGNPPDITYMWEVDSFFDNMIDESNVVTLKDRSLLILTDELMRRDLVDYQCFAFNPVGQSEPCKYSNNTNLN